MQNAMWMPHLLSQSVWSGDVALVCCHEETVMCWFLLTVVCLLLWGQWSQRRTAQWKLAEAKIPLTQSLSQPFCKNKTLEKCWWLFFRFTCNHHDFIHTVYKSYIIWQSLCFWDLHLLLLLKKAYLCCTLWLSWMLIVSWQQRGSWLQRLLLILSVRWCMFCTSAV